MSTLLNQPFSQTFRNSNDIHILLPKPLVAKSQRIPLTKLAARMSEIRTVCKVSLRKRRHKRSCRTPRCRQDDNCKTSLPSLWLCAFDWAGSIHDLVILFSLWWTSLYNSGALLANSSQDQMLICFDFFESAIKAGSNRVYSSVDT